MTYMTAAEIETDVCIIGMPEGKETSEVLRYLQSKEIRCCVYSPGEAADVVAALARPQSPLPFVLEPTYALEEVHMLLRAAMNNGVHLLPLGNQSVWDRFVPLEMPEIADMKVYPTDFDWYRPAVVAETAPAPVQEEPEPSIEGVYVLNGTTVNSLMPNLRVRLADLNEPSMIAPEDPPTVGTDSTVRTVQPAPRPKKSKHLKIKLLLTAVLTLVVAAIAVFLVLNGAPGTNNALSSSDSQAMPSSNSPMTKSVDDAIMSREQQEKLSQHCQTFHGNNPQPLTVVSMQEGVDLGCDVCSRLNNENHTCPVSEDSEAYNKGKELGCSYCTKRVETADAGEPSTTAPVSGDGAPGATTPSNGESGDGAPGATTPSNGESGDGAPGATTPSNGESGDGAPGATTPSNGESGDGAPGATTPSNGESGDGAPEATAPSNGESGDGAPGATTPSNGESGDGAPGATTPSNGESGDGAPGATTPSNGESGDGAPGATAPSNGESGDGAPGATAPSNGESGDGAPGATTPSNGESGDGAPGATTPSNGESGDGAPGATTMNDTASEDDVSGDVLLPSDAKTQTRPFSGQTPVSTPRSTAPREAAPRPTRKIGTVRQIQLEELDSD